MKIKFKSSLCFGCLLFLMLFNLYQMGSFVRVFHIFNRFEEAANYCALRISIRMSWQHFHFSVFFSVPLGILLRIIFLFVFVKWFVQFLEAWGRFELLVLVKTFLEGLNLQLKEFAIRVDVLVLHLSRVKGINSAEIWFIQLSWARGVGEHSAELSLRFSGRISGIWFMEGIRSLVL
jgi:hypothetical protein